MPVLPHTLMNLYNTKHMFEINSHAYYNYGEFESFTCTNIFPSNAFAVSELLDVTEVSEDDAPESSSSTHKSPQKRLVRGPQVSTQSKAAEPKKRRLGTTLQYKIPIG